MKLLLRFSRKNNMSYSNNSTADLKQLKNLITRIDSLISELEKSRDELANNLLKITNAVINNIQENN